MRLERPNQNTFFTHCGEIGHTKLKCYQLIGYPEWWDLAKAPRKWNQRSNTHALAAVVEHTTTCTPQDDSALVTTSSAVAELTSTITPKDDSTLITTSGRVFHTSSTRNSNEWKIDSGATNHMTFDNLCLQSLKPYEQHIISTINGTPSHVIRKCFVTLTKQLSLDSVLVVQNFNHNLLLVAQITLTLQYIMIFCPNLCVLKDIQT